LIKVNYRKGLGGPVNPGVGKKSWGRKGEEGVRDWGAGKRLGGGGFFKTRSLGASGLKKLRLGEPNTRVGFAP